MKNFTIKTSVFVLLVTMLGFGCSEYSAKKQVNEAEEILQHNVQEAKSIFYMLPSPIETASLMQKAGAEYDASILNPVLNVNKYELASTKALNLGVYGSDLSYASVFDQTQEVIFYLSSCKKLADGLGLTNAFDAATMVRIEENINDKDSLLHLISDSYWMVDAYLEENERSNLSALIISGGWVEGLYIATRLALTNPTQELVDRVAEQKLSLTHLLAIINTYKGDHGDVNDVYTELLEIQTIFDKIELTKETVETSTNLETGITTIGGATRMTLSNAVLEEISTKIESIRNRYIQ
ncbi:MAG: hypothetical protein JKY53_00875 [Flavobacteriales bacterium]|nr:hypothetical protein [Flavobacteriales bacterium]